MFMKCTARFYKMNYDFSPEFAEAHHEGKESENNRLHDWEDELAITTDVVDIEVLENSTYTIQGEKGGEAFSEVVSNMLVFNLIGAEGKLLKWPVLMFWFKIMKLKKVMILFILMYI